MKQRNFIIVGDIILDRFIYGDTVRISPEAPALVLDVREEIHSVGGAFNAFSHISSLGEVAKLISVTGSDILKYRDDFPELIKYQENLMLFQDDSRVTSIKTRLVALYKLSYLARYDKETSHEISDNVVDSILKSISQQLDDNSSLLIIDYKKGVITPRLSQELIKLCRLKQVRVYVDSKRDNIEHFSGAYLFKPNKIELKEIKLRYQLSQYDDIAACKILMEKFNLSNIVLTLGAHGMLAITKEGQVISVPGHNVIVKELSGAGDSVLSVLATLISEQHSLSSALEAANNVAASFISTGVTYRAKREDLFKKSC
jgi:D-beta-D-heptose 7-phosphate kinase/D-beta-D-heptose 1-phosphate adenosyltransferase